MSAKLNVPVPLSAKKQQPPLATVRARLVEAVADYVSHPDVSPDLARIILQLYELLCTEYALAARKRERRA